MNGSTGRGRLERQAGPGAEPAQLAGEPHRRGGGLGVERDALRSGLGVARSPAVGVLDHQVGVDGHGADLHERLDDGQTRG